MVPPLKPIQIPLLPPFAKGGGGGISPFDKEGIGGISRIAQDIARTVNDHFVAPVIRHAEAQAKVSQELKQLLGDHVAPVHRDADGALSLRRIPTGNITAFRKFLQDQASQNDNFSFRSPYKSLLQEARYKPLLQLLFREASGQAVDVIELDKLQQLVREFRNAMVDVDAEAYVQNNIATEKGRARIGAILRDDAHYDRDVRADLAKAIARSAKGSVSDREIEAVTNHLSLSNYFNVRIGDDDLHAAEMAALKILQAMDQLDADLQSRRSYGALAATDRPDFLVDMATPAEVNRITQVARDTATAADPVGQLQSQFANLWLFAMDNRNWEGRVNPKDREAHHAMMQVRRHILVNAERMIDESNGVKSQAALQKLIERADDMLTGSLSLKGASFEDFAFHHLAGRGLDSYLTDIKMPSAVRKPFDELLHSVKEFSHTLDMGKQVTLMPPLPQESLGLAEAAPVVRALEQMRYQIWYGYKSQGWASRGVKQLASAMPGSQMGILERGDRDLTRIIHLIGKAETAEDIKFQLEILLSAMEEDGSIYEAIDSAEVGGAEQLMNLAQTTIEIAGPMMVPGGQAAALARLHKISAAFKAARSGAGVVRAGVTALQAGVSGSGGAFTAAEMARGFGGGIYIATAENAMRVASGGVIEGPQSAVSWFKDAVATGASMALTAFLPLHLGRHPPQKLLKNLYARYTVSGMQGAGRFALDAGMEGVEETVDQVLRQGLDGKWEWVSRSQLREIGVISGAGGGAKVGMIAERIRAAGITQPVETKVTDHARTKDIWQRAVDVSTAAFQNIRESLQQFQPVPGLLMMMPVRRHAGMAHTVDYSYLHDAESVRTMLRKIGDEQGFDEGEVSSIIDTRENTAPNGITPLQPAEGHPTLPLHKAFDLGQLPGEDRPLVALSIAATRSALDLRIARDLRYEQLQRVLTMQVFNQLIPVQMARVDTFIDSESRRLGKFASELRHPVRTDHLAEIERTYTLAQEFLEALETVAARMAITEESAAANYRLSQHAEQRFAAELRPKIAAVEEGLRTQWGNRHVQTTQQQQQPAEPPQKKPGDDFATTAARPGRSTAPQATEARSAKAAMEWRQHPGLVEAIGAKHPNAIQSGHVLADVDLHDSRYQDVIADGLEIYAGYIHYAQLPDSPGGPLRMDPLSAAATFLRILDGLDSHPNLLRGPEPSQGAYKDALTTELGTAYDLHPEFVRAALEYCYWNTTELSKKLHVDEGSLDRRLTRYREILHLPTPTAEDQVAPPPPPTRDYIARRPPIAAAPEIVRAQEANRDILRAFKHQKEFGSSTMRLLGRTPVSPGQEANVPLTLLVNSSTGEILHERGTATRFQELRGQGQAVDYVYLRIFVAHTSEALALLQKRLERQGLGLRGDIPPELLAELNSSRSAHSVRLAAQWAIEDAARHGPTAIPQLQDLFIDRVKAVEFDIQSQLSPEMKATLRKLEGARFNEPDPSYRPGGGSTGSLQQQPMQQQQQLQEAPVELDQDTTIAQQRAVALSFRISPKESAFLGSYGLGQESFVDATLLEAVNESMATDALLHKHRLLKGLGVDPESVDMPGYPIASVPLTPHYTLRLEPGFHESKYGMRVVLYQGHGRSEEVLATLGFQETQSGIQVVQYQGTELFDKAASDAAFKKFSGGADPLPWTAYLVGRVLLRQAKGQGKDMQWISGNRLLWGYQHEGFDRPTDIHTFADARRLQSRNRVQERNDAVAQHLGFRRRGEENPWHRYTKDTAEFGSAIRHGRGVDASHFDASVAAATTAMQSDPTFTLWLSARDLPGLPPLLVEHHAEFIPGLSVALRGAQNLFKTHIAPAARRWAESLGIISRRAQLSAEMTADPAVVKLTPKGVPPTQNLDTAALTASMLEMLGQLEAAEDATIHPLDQYSYDPDGRRPSLVGQIPGLTAKLESEFKRGAFVGRFPDGKYFFFRHEKGFIGGTKSGERLSPEDGVRLSALFEVWRSEAGFKSLDSALAKRRFDDLHATLDRHHIRLIQYGDRNPMPRYGIPYQILTQLSGLCPSKLFEGGHIKMVMLGSLGGEGKVSQYKNGTVDLYDSLLQSSQDALAFTFLHEMGYGIVEMLKSAPEQRGRLMAALKVINRSGGPIVVHSPLEDVAGGEAGRRAYTAMFDEFIAEMNANYILAGEYMRREIAAIQDPVRRKAYDEVYHYFKEIHGGREFGGIEGGSSAGPVGGGGGGMQRYRQKMQQQQQPSAPVPRATVSRLIMNIDGMPDIRLIQPDMDFEQKADVIESQTTAINTWLSTHITGKDPDAQMAAITELGAAYKNWAIAAAQQILATAEKTPPELKGLYWHFRGINEIFDQTFDALDRAIPSHARDMRHQAMVTGREVVANPLESILGRLQTLEESARAGVPLDQHALDDIRGAMAQLQLPGLPAPLPPHMVQEEMRIPGVAEIAAVGQRLFEGAKKLLGMTSSEVTPRALLATPYINSVLGKELVDYFKHYFRGTDTVERLATLESQMPVLLRHIPLKRLRPLMKTAEPNDEPKVKFAFLENLAIGFSEFSLVKTMGAESLITIARGAHFQGMKSVVDWWKAYCQTGLSTDLDPAPLAKWLGAHVWSGARKSLHIPELKVAHRYRDEINALSRDDRTAMVVHHLVEYPFLNLMDQHGMVQKFGFQQFIQIWLALERRDKTALRDHLATAGYETSSLDTIAYSLLRYSNSDGLTRHYKLSLLAYSHTEAGAVTPQIGHFFSHLDAIDALSAYKAFKDLAVQYGIQAEPEVLAFLARRGNMDLMHMAAVTTRGAVDSVMAFRALLHRYNQFQKMGLSGYPHWEVRIPNTPYTFLLSKGTHESSCGLDLKLSANGKLLGNIGFLETEDGIYVTNIQGGKLDDADIVAQFEQFSGGVHPLQWLALVGGELLRQRAKAANKSLLWIAGHRVRAAHPHGPTENPAFSPLPDDPLSLGRPKPRTVALYDHMAEDLGFDPADTEKDVAWHRWTSGPQDFGAVIRVNADHKTLDASVAAAHKALRGDASIAPLLAAPLPDVQALTQRPDYHLHRGLVEYDSYTNASPLGRLKDAVARHPGGRILELGPGHGHAAAELKRLYPDVQMVTAHNLPVASVVKETAADLKAERPEAPPIEAAPIPPTSVNVTTGPAETKSVIQDVPTENRRILATLGTDRGGATRLAPGSKLILPRPPTGYTSFYTFHVDHKTGLIQTGDSPRTKVISISVLSPLDFFRLTANRWILQRLVQENRITHDGRVLNAEIPKWLSQEILKWGVRHPLFMAMGHAKKDAVARAIITGTPMSLAETTATPTLHDLFRNRVDNVTLTSEKPVMSMEVIRELKALRGSAVGESPLREREKPAPHPPSPPEIQAMNMMGGAMMMAAWMDDHIIEMTIGGMAFVAATWVFDKKLRVRDTIDYYLLKTGMPDRWIGNRSGSLKPPRPGDNEIAAFLRRLDTIETQFVLQDLARGPADLSHADQILAPILARPRSKMAQRFAHFDLGIEILRRASPDPRRAFEVLAQFSKKGDIGDDANTLPRDSLWTVFHYLPKALGALERQGMTGDAAKDYLLTLAEHSRGSTDHALEWLGSALAAMEKTGIDPQTARSEVLRLAQKTGENFGYALTWFPGVFAALQKAGIRGQAALDLLKPLEPHLKKPIVLKYITTFLILLQNRLDPEADARSFMSHYAHILNRLTNYNAVPVLDAFGHFARTLKDRRHLLKAAELVAAVLEHHPQHALNFVESLRAPSESYAGILLEILPEPDELIDFIRKAKGFNPAVWNDYQERGDTALAVLDALATRNFTTPITIAEVQAVERRRGRDYLLAVLQRISPIGTSATSHEEYIHIAHDMLAAGDLSHHVPKSWQGRVEVVDLETGGWRPKGGQKIDGDGKVATLLGKLRPNLEGEVAEVTHAQIVHDLLAGEIDVARQKLYRGVGEMHELRHKIDDVLDVDHSSLQTLEQILTDKDGVPKAVADVLDSIPDEKLFQSQNFQPLKTNRLEALARLVVATDDAENDARPDPEALQKRVSSILRHFSPGDVRSLLLPHITAQYPKETWASEAVARYANTAAEVKRTALSDALLRDARELIRSELAKFDYHGSGQMRLGIRPVKGPTHVLHGVTGAYCTESDVALWKNPNYSLLAMVDEDQHQAVGYADVLHLEDGGKKYMVLLGINPSIDFMNKTNGAELYRKFMAVAEKLAHDAGYDAILIPTDPTIHSNRSEILTAIEKAKYAIHTLKKWVKWASNYAYDFNEAFVAWKRDMVRQKQTEQQQQQPAGPKKDTHYSGAPWMEDLLQSAWHLFIRKVPGTSQNENGAAAFAELERLIAAATEELPELGRPMPAYQTARYRGVLAILMDRVADAIQQGARIVSPVDGHVLTVERLQDYVQRSYGDFSLVPETPAESRLRREVQEAIAGPNYWAHLRQLVARANDPVHLAPDGIWDILHPTPNARLADSRGFRMAIDEIRRRVAEDIEEKGFASDIGVRSTALVHSELRFRSVQEFHKFVANGLKPKTAPVDVPPPFPDHNGIAPEIAMKNALVLSGDAKAIQEAGTYYHVASPDDEHGTTLRHIDLYLDKASGQIRAMTDKNDAPPDIITACHHCTLDVVDPRNLRSGITYRAQLAFDRPTQRVPAKLLAQMAEDLASPLIPGTVRERYRRLMMTTHGNLTLRELADFFAPMVADAHLPDEVPDTVRHPLLTFVGTRFHVPATPPPLPSVTVTPPTEEVTRPTAPPLVIPFANDVARKLETAVIGAQSIGALLRMLDHSKIEGAQELSQQVASVWQGDLPLDSLPDFLKTEVETFMRQAVAQMTADAGDYRRLELRDEEYRRYTRPIEREFHLLVAARHLEKAITGAPSLNELMMALTGTPLFVHRLSTRRLSELARRLNEGHPVDIHEFPVDLGLRQRVRDLLEELEVAGNRRRPTPQLSKEAMKVYHAIEKLEQQFSKPVRRPFLLDKRTQVDQVLQDTIYGVLHRGWSTELLTRQNNIRGLVKGVMADIVALAKGILPEDLLRYFPRDDRITHNPRTGEAVRHSRPESVYRLARTLLNIHAGQPVISAPSQMQLAEMQEMVAHYYPKSTARSHVQIQRLLRNELDRMTPTLIELMKGATSRQKTLVIESYFGAYRFRHMKNLAHAFRLAAWLGTTGFYRELCVILRGSDGGHHEAVLGLGDPDSAFNEVDADKAILMHTHPQLDERDNQQNLPDILPSRQDFRLFKYQAEVGRTRQDSPMHDAQLKTWYHWVIQANGGSRITGIEGPGGKLARIVVEYAVKPDVAPTDSLTKAILQDRAQMIDTVGIPVEYRAISYANFLYTLPILLDDTL